MSFSSKRENKKSKKEKESNSIPSTGDTFFDSLHNSKLAEFAKNKIITSNQKENNFYLALKCMQLPYSDPLLLGTSEFSEFNPNQTKDYNISRYLHRPIIKEINKEGNKLIRIKPMQNYDSIINHPYTCKYNNMKNIFNDILISVKDIKSHENTFKNEIMHKKNYSSISNYINNNNSNNNIIFRKKNIDTSKNKKINNSKSNQVNSTTATKEYNNYNYNYKNNYNNNFADINNNIEKQIKYNDNLEDLEESKDIDIKDYIINEEMNKNIFLKDYSNINISSLKSNKNLIGNNIIDDIENGGEIEKIKKIENNSISTKKDEIYIIDSFNDGQNQDFDMINKNENKTTTIKKLRKKYERTEFKKYIFNTNPHINRYIYENKDDINKDININKRKKTDDLNFKKSKKYKMQYTDYNNNNLVKQNIQINTKHFSELEDSLSQLSNNINKNLLDNFNNCGNIKNNDFLMRNSNENNLNYNINENQNNNLYYIESSNKSKTQYSIPPAELLDFISNKSENNINVSVPNDFCNINNNLNNSNNNNTFVIKNIDDNKLDNIYSDISNTNLNNEINRSAKSEIKINHMKNNPLHHNHIRHSDNINNINMNNICNIDNLSDEYKKYNENEDNYFYDFVTPEKNPEAIIRKNFSLFSSYDSSKTNTKSNILSDSNINNNDYKFNSFINKIENTKYKKDFSFITKNVLSDKEIINSVRTKKNVIAKRNIRNNSYLKENKDKIRDSITHPQPETIYDLTFYKNLIENSLKIKKINCKNFLKNQKKIKFEDRIHTMVWMMQICEEFAFKRDTFHYACNYFDNYLTFGQEKIKNKKILELIGITCISISGKIEEVQIPKLKEYANSIDESFDIKDIIEMEQNICLTLGWKLINVNINTWLNWYTCQWDLYIDSVDDIKSQLLKYIKEDEIIYYKKSNDISYYNYRKICQLIDLIVIDYFSYNFESRILMAVCLLIIICINYKFDYNFKKKNFKQKTPFSKYIFNVYNQFINQSFDYNFNDKNIQKALEYCYKFKNFNFTYELPLLYQIHQELLENGNYEDFISYQTTNENMESYLKEIINKRNKKNSSEKATNNTDKNKFSSSKKSYY